MTNEEMLAKAKSAKSPEDIMNIAKEGGSQISLEKAEDIFKALNKSGELSDDEIKNAAGGGCYRNGIYIVGERFSCDDYECRRCGSGKAGCTCWEPVCLTCVHHGVRYVDYGDPNKPNGNADICVLHSHL